MTRRGRLSFRRVRPALVQPRTNHLPVPRRRYRLPHLFRLRPRLRRDLGQVAMARPGAARPQRGGYVVVPPPRRISGV